MIFFPEISWDTAMLWSVVGYLLGSIPSGVLIAHAMGLGNLREIGSGNIGATNVLRTGNKSAAALTLLFDALKGVLAVLLARYFADSGAAQVAAVAALLGHCFPIWLKFKGGKGVATYFGVIFALAWPLGIVAAIIWLSVAAISRYSSMAALVVAGWLPLVMMFAGYASYFLMGVVLGLLVYLRHWGNIQRLRDGTETKIGAKSTS
ncbi:glycerol-3-phosphate 1-O-acyltransferase PlsY [Cognatiyoonia sp. IB215446]|uniref:glycerol-3-phosphate 1-O-acyltransferase PlsY n=1 Tax=Cognatiyoonia sp. IB215446 TaxID=3097355 RepID=UPI002A176E79|nr:glycerol-3-phosphate 1-O-acyltransferase PlsY [Cognatiyoonia sp. IB215446]MDX8350073.1 glycerol-3-phosphate 1-O-acyltransferase PlsY [Cognatiyoonia sp. IB215446]